MFIFSSLKTSREVPWVLIITLINLALLGEPVEAIKCYRCTCWSDCVRNKNLFHEMECPARNNACLTRVPTSESEDYIAKQCWSKNNKEVTEDRNAEKGRIYKFCYTDLCNDQEAGGIKNPNPRGPGSSSNSTNGGGGGAVACRAKITGRFFVPPAMIMAYFNHWLIN